MLQQTHEQSNKVAGKKFVAHHMLPKIDRLAIPRNFVATRHQRHAACCTQQFTAHSDLLPARLRVNFAHVITILYAIVSNLAKRVNTVTVWPRPSRKYEVTRTRGNN